LGQTNILTKTKLPLVSFIVGEAKIKREDEDQDR
jgi:hypothetical protein